MLKHLSAWLRFRWSHAAILWLAGALVGAGEGQAAPATQTLTLPAALERALDNNPNLRVFAPRLKALAGQRLSADQAPAYNASLDAENLFGTDGYSGTDAAELTLSLSSVIELGGKREARTRVAGLRHELARERETAESLALLGEVTRQFVSTLALQEKLRLADQSVDLAEALRDGVRRRSEHGATPRAELLRAASQVARTRLDRQRLEAVYRAECAALSALLGQDVADFTRLDGDLLIAHPQLPFDELWSRARSNPYMRVLAGETRLREAELALATSRSKSDINWQLGARYLAESNDTALVARLSMPLFSGRRNRGEVQAARAAREEAGLQHDAELLALRSRLYRAYSEYGQARQAVRGLGGEVIPPLREALEFTRQAYDQGRYSYLELQSARRELLDAENARVDAATTALLNQSFIEQLTAQSLVASDFAPAEQAEVENHYDTP